MVRQHSQPQLVVDPPRTDTLLCWRSVSASTVTGSDGEATASKCCTRETFVLFTQTEADCGAMPYAPTPPGSIGIRRTTRDGENLSRGFWSAITFLKLVTKPGAPSVYYSSTLVRVGRS
jgi:hypothetical protein